jgi:hypothetical protein
MIQALTAEASDGSRPTAAGAGARSVRLEPALVSADATIRHLGASLKEGHDIWPSPPDGAVAISAVQLAMLEGIDWRNPLTRGVRARRAELRHGDLAACCSGRSRRAVIHSGA